MEPIATISASNKKRWSWFSPPVLLLVSILGYLLDGIKGVVGNVFNFIALAALLVALAILIRDTTKKKTGLAMSWLLLIIALLIGIYT